MIKVAAATGLALVLVLAGCSSSKSPSSSPTSSGAGSASASTSASGSSAVSTAQSVVNTLTGAWPDVTAPGPSVNGAALKGKKVYYISIAYVVPYFHSVEAGLAAGLAKVGATVIPCDANASPSGASACMSTAITQGASVVITDSIPLAFAQNAYTGLSAAHIPVVLVDLASTDSVNSTDSIAYVVGNDKTNPTAWGQYTADDVFLAAAGKPVDALYVNLAVGPQTIEATAGAQAEYAKICPSTCKTAIATVTSSDQNQASSAVSGALLKDPNINYIVCTSGIFQGVQAGVTNASATNHVKIVGITEGVAAMQSLKQKQLVYSMVGTSPYFEGWALADQSIRVGAGAPPVQQYNLPIRIYTQDNVQSLNLTDAGFNSSQWFGGGDFPTMFGKLWGAS